MVLWSAGPAGTRETAFASARRDVRGVVSGLICGEDASRFASWIGVGALRTKGISDCPLTVRSRHFERRGRPPWTSRLPSPERGGPYPIYHDRRRTAME